MSDNKQLPVAVEDVQPGTSLLRMLVVGLVLIVLGMFAVVFIA
jgi:hypothetical protein